MKRYTFSCPVPAAKKNRARILRPGRPGARPIICPSRQAVYDEGVLQAQLIDTLDMHPVGCPCGACPPPFFRDHDVSVSILYRPRDGLCAVDVDDVGPRPKGFTGRARDVGNIPEVILDAMQGVLVLNDNQVADLRVWREL